MNGKKIGTHTGWWPDGKMQFRYIFKDGEWEGEQTEWHSNGQTASLFHYHLGHETGVQKAWRENGRIYINLVVTNGQRYGLFNAKLCFQVKDGDVRIGGHR